MHLTTEKWSPSDCGCWVNHMFLEGPDAPPVDDSNKNMMMYCPLEKATAIRKSKHEARLSYYADKGDLEALTEEKRWWKKKQKQPYTEKICPDHQGIANHPWYIVLRDEAARRQLSINLIQNLNPALRESSDFDPAFSWEGTDGNRVLTLYLSSQEIRDIGSDLQPMLDIQFGPGKVKIEDKMILQEDLIQQLLAL